MGPGRHRGHDGLGHSDHAGDLPAFTPKAVGWHIPEEQLLRGTYPPLLIATIALALGYILSGPVWSTLLMILAIFPADPDGLGWVLDYHRCYARFGLLYWGMEPMLPVSVAGAVFLGMVSSTSLGGLVARWAGLRT